MPCRVWIVLFICAILPAWSTARADAAAASPPRYSLPVGRRLTYSMVSQEKGDGVAASSSSTWQITVVKQNTDGSRRLVFRIATKDDQIIEGRTVDAPDRVILDSADVFPDGRTAAAVTPDLAYDPGTIFPRLPTAAADLSNGWTGGSAARLESLNFTAHVMDAKDWDFSSSQVGLFAKLYALTKDTSYHFDIDKGILSKMESETGQTYGAHLSGSEKVELLSDATVPPDQSALLDSDVESFTRARHAYSDQLDKAMHVSPDDAGALVTQAESDLTTASAAAKNTDVQAQYQQMLSMHDQVLSFLKDEAVHEIELLNRPAFDFSTTDIDGQPVKIADYRGKVVLLTFWNRGESWAMYTIPQIQQIADDFRDKPVALLGMNTDDDVKDAQFVIDAQQIKYPTIRATALKDPFGVRVFPTLILIDASGIVRHIHVGYSPTLRQDIGREIQSLLDQKTAAANP